MKHKKFYVGFLSGFLCCLLAAGIGLQVWGANRNIIINDSINVEFNGQAFTPKDANGRPVPVFTYEGTTYAPIRALCQAAGMEVDYDSAARTAKVTAPAAPTPTPTPVSPQPTDPGPLVDAPWGGGMITEAQAIRNAKQYAMENGAQGEMSLATAELDVEDREYEVEFLCGGKKYEVHVDALGGINGFSVSNVYQPGPTTGPDLTLTLESAKKIALDHAGLAANDVTFTKSQLDREDNEYEIEFVYGDMAYEYDVDVTTGAIRSYSHRQLGPENTPAPGASLTAAQAQEAALAKAPSGSVVVKCELEREDGRLIYEIELRNGWSEYECEIDAQTGEVLKWKLDA